MGIFDSIKHFISGRPSKLEDISTSISNAPSPADIEEVLKERTKLLGKVYSYEFKGGSANLSRSADLFTPPAYDLSEIGKAVDVEPYIAQSVRKHREQILKEGYQLEGVDEEMVAYVKNRLFEIAMLSEITTEQLIREFTTNLILYHNSYFIFRRDKNRSSGSSVRLFGKTLQPIAGVFPCDPTTMSVSVNKFGTPEKWMQKIGTLGSYTDAEKDTKFDPEDVLHATMDKKSGYTYGTPYILPVLDDVRALRKLEEIAIVLSTKEAFPLYHIKVGSDDSPAVITEGGSSEVASAASSIQSMPLQGNIITSHRHEIILVSKGGSALDITPFLEYFEARVLAGLRLSELDLGRGGSANKGTAQNLNKGLQDAAKDYQQVISDTLTFKLVTPLLLEGGYDVNPDNIVKLTFPTIDKEEQRANQNHGLQMYLSSSISEDEFRKEYLNKKPLSDEERSKTNRATELHSQKEMVSHQAAVAPSPTTKKVSDSSKSVSRAVSSKARPSNQYGKLATKSKFTANDFKSIVDTELANIRDLVINAKDNTTVEQIFNDFIDNVVDISKPIVIDAIQEGVYDCFSSVGELGIDMPEKKYVIGKRTVDRFINNFVVKSFTKSISPYKEQAFAYLKKDSDNNNCKYYMIGAVESLRKALHRLVEDQIITSNRYGYCKLAKIAGFSTIRLESKDKGSKIISLESLAYKDLIPELDDRSEIRLGSDGKTPKGVGQIEDHG